MVRKILNIIIVGITILLCPLIIIWSFLTGLIAGLTVRIIKTFNYEYGKAIEEQCYEILRNLGAK